MCPDVFANRLPIVELKPRETDAGSNCFRSPAFPPVTTSPLSPLRTHMSARRTASAVFSLILLVTLVVPSTGCRLCADCEMDAYPAYGGAWERTLRETGRVGSVFDPGGVRAADIEARTDPETADRRIRSQSRYDNDSATDSGEDRQKKSDDEQRKLDEETRDNDKTPEQQKAELEELEKRLEGLNLQDIRYVEPRENQSDWN